MYRLLALDIDRTLVGSNNLLSEENTQAIYDLQNRGIHIILTTGRPYSTLGVLEKKLRLTDPVITCDGALIVNLPTKEILHKSQIPKDSAEKAVQTAEELTISLMVIGEEKIYAKMAEEDYKYVLSYGYSNLTIVEDLMNHIEPAPLQLMMVAYGKDDLYQDAVSMFREKFEGHLSVVTSSPYWMEVLAMDTSKGSALKRTAKILNIADEDTVAIGDGVNDISMLEFAGYAIAVENAAELVKRHADEITASCDGNGVAKAIEKLIERGMF